MHATQQVKTNSNSNPTMQKKKKTLESDNNPICKFWVRVDIFSPINKRVGLDTFSGHYLDGRNSVIFGGFLLHEQFLSARQLSSPS